MEKNNRVLIGIIVLLIVVIIGLCGFVFINMNRNSNNGSWDTLEKDENKDQNGKTEEKELTDVDVKEELKDIVLMLHFHDVEVGDISLYKDLLLSDKEKLKIALDNSDATKIIIPKDKISVDISMEQLFADYNNKMVTVTVVEDEYYSLFNEELTSHMDVDGCPFYTYDSVNKVYYALSDCGGTSDSTILDYINKYTYNNSEAYVYMNVGVSSWDYDTDKRIIYTDLEGTKQYNSNDSENFEINESNYQDFSEYKYTFGKNSDGNYYFKGIEKTK